MSENLDVKTRNLLKGIISILKRRKFKVLKEDHFENYIDLYCESEEDSTQEMFTRISLEDKVGVSVLRDYFKKLDDRKEEKGEDNVKGLLVASNRFTHYARREAKENNIWIITSKDPRFDIFTHDLVPEHIICPDDELNALLKKYNIQRRHLPKILANDPAVKAIGAKPGQVVKIYRNSNVAGESIAYRLVVRKTG